MVDHHHWQLDGSAPELYERFLVPAITQKWADDLVGRAQPRSGEAVLDVACGTGVVARSASRCMLHGHVTGLDLNKGMLTVAQIRVSEGAPINWIEGSALDLPFSAEKFDLVLCQLGLQFFPDQGRALREMRRVLSPTGRVALSVYSPIERTPGANAFVLALDHVLGPNASKIKRGEHSFNAPDELRELLDKAGFAKVDVQTVVQQIAFPSVLDYVRFQLLATPMAALLIDRDETDRQAAIATIALETASFSDRAMLEGGAFSFRQEAYVGTGLATG
ncbi:class I SAM-dependent methyltransferase [Bradyrhizobium sp. AUGA SZCCT0283]|uniref:class I SAM-dependent methyltransferase n=1 Tax=Bradyrhizobium sp. AUGA SZCCT0283 TaxID=2807671 RepID=UPI002010EDFA|nr:class I SAM-dependent methyltransferase [Bradyrhizobium sp. AUGA SZCCT0283]